MSSFWIEFFVKQELILPDWVLCQQCKYRIMDGSDILTCGSFSMVLIFPLLLSKIFSELVLKLGILETLSMSEKALKMLSNISDTVNAAARPEVSRQFWSKNFTSLVYTSYHEHLRINGSINLDYFTEMPQSFGRSKCRHKKKKLISR